MSSSPTLSVQDHNKEDLSSDSSSHTIRDQLAPHPTMSAPELDASVNLGGAFGTPTQQFAQKFLNLLHKFQLTTRLTDLNYKAWSQPILEAFMTIDFEEYLLTPNHRAVNLPSPLHEKVKFLITTYLLKLCDENKEELVRSVLKSGTGSNTLIVYDLHLLWMYLKTRHHTITEGKL